MSEKNALRMQLRNKKKIRALRISVAIYHLKEKLQMLTHVTFVPSIPQHFGRPADRHGPKNGFRLSGHILYKFVYNMAIGYY